MTPAPAADSRGEVSPTIAALTGHTRRLPDILECIANLSNDEVFTPPDIANAMLDLLPKHVWSEPTYRWLDPGCKTGVFLREIAKRLMVGLADAFPDEDERRDHIFRNMLHALAITELTGLVSRRTVYCSKDATSPKSLSRLVTTDGNVHYNPAATHNPGQNGRCMECGAAFDPNRESNREAHAYTFIHPQSNPLSEVFDMQFDVIIGNPPYQMNDGGFGASAAPIYHLFVERAKALNPRYLSMIIPARWYAGGKGLDDFRKEMLADKSIRNLTDYADAGDCFPGVEIKGGVCFFLWDRDHPSNDCAVSTITRGKLSATHSRRLDEYDVFIRHRQGVVILAKVQEKKEPTLEVQVSARKPFGFSTNFTDFKKKEFSNSVKIYARGTVGWVARDKIAVNPQWVDAWKVLTSRAYGAGETFPHQMTGVPIVVAPGSACTETYLVAGTFASKLQAERFESYMKTRFFRFLVALRKNTQDLNQGKFSFVPQLDMRVKWTDEMLYARYGITEEEQSFIESQVREMP